MKICEIKVIFLESSSNKQNFYAGPITLSIILSQMFMRIYIQSGYEICDEIYIRVYHGCNLFNCLVSLEISVSFSNSRRSVDYIQLLK